MKENCRARMSIQHFVSLTFSVLRSKSSIRLVPFEWLWETHVRAVQIVREMGLRPKSKPLFGDSVNIQTSENNNNNARPADTGKWTTLDHEESLWLPFFVVYDRIGLWGCTRGKISVMRDLWIQKFVISQGALFVRANFLLSRGAESSRPGAGRR